MSHMRYTAHIGERGRFVVPADARRRLRLETGDLVVIDVEADTLVVRKAADVAQGLRGYLLDVEPGRDLAGELIADRRAEAEREAGRREAGRGGAAAQR